MFDEGEFLARLEKAQGKMAKAGLDALLLTTHPDLFYFTGFLTRFWESPTRPWFLIVPQSGMPVAVIPGIGAALMAKTWIEDIRTWSAPNLEDDGVTLLADTLDEIIGDGRIGIPSGHETSLRMPLQDFERLKKKASGIEFTGDAGIVRALRMVKSPAEIGKIRNICTTAERAFARMGEIAKIGASHASVFRNFQRLLLEEGADWVPYLAGGAGPHGYDDVISPAAETPLTRGDVLMLDTGAVRDGYFCDFDRNFAIGLLSRENKDAHRKLIEATRAGFDAAKPGNTAADLFHAMDKVLTGGSGKSDVGRLGHGLGIQLTEWPSLIPADDTILEDGMVLTLEPGIQTRDQFMLVHEENIVVKESGSEYLTRPYAEEMEVIG